MNKTWYKLDTAALIFPAIMKDNWANVFRLSAHMSEEVDPLVLKEALVSIKDRYPTIFASVKAGFFWFYLENSEILPEVKQDYAYPLTRMGRNELAKCGLRVLYFENRIAIEIFHSLTDGTGASIFFKALLARYIEIKYGISIDNTGYFPSLNEEVTDEETENSFFKNSNNRPLSRREPKSYKYKGTPTKNGFQILTTGIIETDKLLELAHKHDCTVTTFVTAVMIDSFIRLQKKNVPSFKHRFVKIAIPINLRKLYNSKTLRNFVLAFNVGVDPRLGEYSLDDIIRFIKAQMSMFSTTQSMSSRIAANTMAHNNILVRGVPLFIKNIVMRAVYRSTAEITACLNISNLGQIKLPESMSEYISRMDFIIPVQRNYPNNCSMASYGNVTTINIIRNIIEAEVERVFFSKLVELGIPVEIQSNYPGGKNNVLC